MSSDSLKEIIERGDARPVSRATLQREEELRKEFLSRGHRSINEHRKLVQEIQARARAQAREEELNHAGRIMVFASPRTRRQYIEKMLEVRGHTVHAALELKDCLKNLGEHRFDLMIMNLEGMESLEMTRRLKGASESLQELPFVVCTDRTSIKDVIQANQLKILSWFTRPYRADEFVDDVCDRVNEIRTASSQPAAPKTVQIASPVVVRKRSL